jgi:hypothetical protein
MTLQQFVESNRRGRNYDFSSAEEIVAFVVSPFVEWTWNRSDRLWVGDTPRILSAREAISLVT